MKIAAWILQPDGGEALAWGSESIGTRFDNRESILSTSSRIFWRLRRCPADNTTEAGGKGKEEVQTTSLQRWFLPDLLSLLAGGGDTVVYEAVILCYSAILFKRF